MTHSQHLLEEAQLLVQEDEAFPEGVSATQDQDRVWVVARLIPRLPASAQQFDSLFPARHSGAHNGRLPEH